MKIRPYEASDWEAVREIYDLSKPDEMRGGVDVRAVVPLGQDPSGLALFRDSVSSWPLMLNGVVGFGGHKFKYISWLFVHPAHRRRGIARALLKEIIGHLQGAITLNVGHWNHAARKLFDELGFVVGAARRTVTRSIEGAMAPDWIGTELVRGYRFLAPNRVELRLLTAAEGPSVGNTVLVWERVSG